jgi:KUP system potassium uptake protein
MIATSFRKLSILVPAKESIKALGIVFGDIGTSPIYTLTIIFALINPGTNNVMGVLSLIVWTLFFLVSVQYAWLAMSNSQKGEGGTIVLREILVSLLNSSKLKKAVTFLSFIGISFLIGDGVITPAISILAAVEGIALIPAFEHINVQLIVLIACIICVLLFAFQRKGTETVSVIFGPIMVLWFLLLAGSGLFWLSKDPSVLKAINPWYALAFMYHNKWRAFFVLSKVILCATGGEALYADMGHLGRMPIIRAWIFAFIVLIINYLGQGAFILQNTTHTKIFYEMILHIIPQFYVAFLILSMFATIIASQAMISGIFSIVYQGITTNIMPKLKIDYTSRKLRSQIYIPFINWSLMALALFAILEFKKSENLANAYGFAATVTMTITSFMLICIFFLKGQWIKTGVSIFVWIINGIYLLSCATKIPYGAYWSIIIAMIPLSLIIIYTTGKKRLYQSLRPILLTHFIEQFETARSTTNIIRGTSVFFASDTKKIPSYIPHTMFTNNIIYENNIIVSVTTQDKPFGITTSFKEDPCPGLRIFEIRMGYMEIMNLEKVLRSAKIDPKVIFYGLEEIETKNIFWKIFALIKKLTPSFVQFYKLPSNQLHGVIMRVEM